jgi:glycosyltransferase involved in cell wall biosynthesis
MSELGGPPHSLLKLLKYIKPQHEVAVVVPGSGTFSEELEQKGIPYYCAGPHRLTRRSIPWLCQLIIRGKFDLVYGNSFSSGPRNALVASKLTGRPFIWHIREMLIEGTKWRTAFFLRFADQIIAVSQDCAQLVERYVPKKKVQTVYNGVEFNEFQLEITEARNQVRRILGVSQDHLVVVNVGTVSARKGQAYGVKAAMEILKGYPKTTFAFLGDLVTEPEYACSLTTHAGKMDGEIQFLGFRRDVPHFLLGCDIFLHTAAWDPNPRAILEAMAARLPVVAFSLDGVKEQIVNGETGYLVPVGDVNDTVEVLKAYLDNPSLRKRMGEKGIKRVQAMFTAEETANSISKIVHNILEKSAS